MDFELITLDGVKTQGEIYEVLIPTSTGDIAVFPGHESLVTVVVPGVISIRHKKGDSDDKLEDLAVSHGVAEISQKLVRILADSAVNSEEIIEQESKDALSRAIALRDKANSQIELDQAHQLIDRHSVRLKVAELRRHRRQR